MTETSRLTEGARAPFRYERPMAALHFPTEDEVPETKRHLELRTALYLVLKANFAQAASIGCDQFVYWDPTRPSECLAPDLFLRLGEPDRNFESWKVWERGAPDVAVEILSPSDARDGDLTGKLEKYTRLGVRELVTFDPDDAAEPIRIWSFREGDRVKRVLDTPHTALSEVLGLFWTVVEDASVGPMLRLSRDPLGGELLFTPEEAERAARKTAEQRVAELQAELSAMKGST